MGRSHLDLLALLALALLVARLLSDALARFKIPSVAVELLTGIALGALAPIPLRKSELLSGLSELGVLIFLFLVGLETRLASLRKVGADSLRVATLGVLAPVGLALLLLPRFRQSGTGVLLFISASLCATSIGVSVRALRDARKLESPTGQVILGAAVIDDIMGVMILSVVSAIATRGQADWFDLIAITLKSAVLVSIILLSRRWILPWVLSKGRNRGSDSSRVIFSLSLCLLFAGVAEKAGLAGILGAFALGAAIEDEHLESLIKPIADFLVPVFFISLGTSVDLSAFLSLEALVLGGLLSVFAFLGKFACGLGVRAPGTDRWLTAFGMLPRGEVGLIFAVMGLRIGVLHPTEYSAILMMVVATTLAAPFLLSWRAHRMQGGTLNVTQTL